MAKIATYINDTNIVSADKWIGSDSQSNWQTKNFTAGDVAEFINKKKTQSQLLRYSYQTEGNRASATISFDPYGSDNVPFNGIQSFVLSKFDEYSLEHAPPVDVSTLYNSPFIGSYILLTQADNMSEWAIYQWDQQAQDPQETNFYNITVTYKAGNGGLNKNEDYFISLLTYDAISASDKNFVYPQNTSSTTWIVTHNLGKYPSVSVVDSGDTAIYGEIQYNSLNQVTITFLTAVSGSAFFN